MTKSVVALTEEVLNGKLFSLYSVVKTKAKYNFFSSFTITNALQMQTKRSEADSFLSPRV